MSTWKRRQSHFACASAFWTRPRENEQPRNARARWRQSEKRRIPAITSQSGESESFLENRLAIVSKMIQSCSAETVACCFLSDGNRARAGARVVERFTE